MSNVASKVRLDTVAREGGKIAGHWDTIEAMPALAKWKYSNGKF
jgi:predicted SnoaL-like aldol condensation-catalyzing enzyme